MKHCEILTQSIIYAENGYIGNKNATKDEVNKATSFIHARCKQGDKAAWVKAAEAQKMKLTEWIVKALNNSV